MKCLAGLTAAIIALMTLTGCGIKSAPLPPVIRVADPTRDLTVVQLDRQAVLRWSYPSSTTAGEPLHDLESIEIWRATLIEVEAPPPGEKPADKNLNRQLLLANGELVADLDEAALTAATRGAQLEWRDDLAAWHRDNPAPRQQMLWYAVRSVCCGGRESGLSNIARIVPRIPPDPPTELSVTAEEAGLRLRFSPNEALPVLVERSADGANWAPASSSPIEGGEWLDRTATQGASWTYRLRSVTRPAGEPRVVGPPSEPETLAYPDVYPPAAPAGFVCLPEGMRVRLRWQAADQQLRYRIRRVTDDGKTVLLVDDLANTQYEDLAPPAGTSIYSLSALDPAGNESETVSCTAARGAIQ